MGKAIPPEEMVPSIPVGFLLVFISFVWQRGPQTWLNTAQEPAAMTAQAQSYLGGCRNQRTPAEMVTLPEVSSLTTSPPNLPAKAINHLQNPRSPGNTGHASVPTNVHHPPRLPPE